MYKKILDELYYEDINNELNNNDNKSYDDNICDNEYDNEYYSIKNASKIHKYYTDKLKVVTQLPQMPYKKCNFASNGECKIEFNLFKENY